MKVKVTHLCPILCDPMDCNSPWNSLGQNTRVPFPSPGDLPNSGIKPRSPSLQADSLPAEPQGKSNNTAVSSLSLHQQIFPMQELNQGLLHCRWIAYQLSYQESLTGKPHTKRAWWSPCSLRPSWILSTVLWMSSLKEFHSSSQARITISDGQNSFCIYYLAFSISQKLGKDCEIAT